MDQILLWSDLSSLNRLIPVESLKLGPVDLTKAFDNLISASSSARRPFRLILLTKFQMIPGESSAEINGLLSLTFSFQRSLIPYRGSLVSQNGSLFYMSNEKNTIFENWY